MKKFYLTVGGILTILGSGGIYNDFDVEIVFGQKVIVFDTKSECNDRKKEIIEMFDKKELKPDQAFVLKAFASQSCGSILENDVPQSVNDMTVTDHSVYYTKAKYNQRKNALFEKTKATPHNITVFELFELTGILNEEIKSRGNISPKSITPLEIILALEK